MLQCKVSSYIILSCLDKLHLAQSNYMFFAVEELPPLEKGII